MHGFCRTAKQNGGFHEAEVARWSQLDKFREVEASLRFEHVADDKPTMMLNDARERPYLFMRLGERSDVDVVPSLDGAYYVCLAWHGASSRVEEPSAVPQLSTPVRKPMLRRASASSQLTPFSWASVVAGRPTSPSPPASPTLALEALPERSELKATGDGGCGALVESTSALDISEADFPAPPLSPRLGREQRRRAVSSASFISPTRSLSRSAEFPRYTGAFADATLTGLYVPSDGSDVRMALCRPALISAGPEARPRLRRLRPVPRFDPSPLSRMQLGCIHDSLTAHTTLLYDRLIP